jgi:hypothetical protein
MMQEMTTDYEEFLPILAESEEGGFGLGGQKQQSQRDRIKELEGLLTQSTVSI